MLTYNIIIHVLQRARNYDKLSQHYEDLYKITKELTKKVMLVSRWKLIVSKMRGYFQHFIVLHFTEKSSASLMESNLSTRKLEELF